MKYDDVSWHNGAADYPKDLSDEAAATHTGMFVVWALLSGLGGELHTKELPDNIPRLQARSVAPGRFFLDDCDGKFIDEELNAEGNAFAKAYFDLDKGGYLQDYDAVLCRGLATAYHVPDTWENFDKLKPRLDRRLAEWRRGAWGRKPWWKFWES
jgi:hypothetical protein